MTTSLQMQMDVKNALKDAKGIAWDTCHKIYVLMDDEQMAKMEEYGYDPLFSSNELSTEEMYRTVQDWYANSCSLRFIDAVSTVAGDPNAGFETLVSQMDDWHFSLR